ncbi:phage baseplate assembly protein V [Sansalvadorimonas verongulae]|uniref:phage baseplate assembly protein V n=1 Tax=Sansalvadorimonas verongulae TaxID=2172824 RepID=UPI0012BD03FC|nr:phage baseplate assembly protein V [Sansalvadorimonas verongulae]MTI12632.1 phage baseplate assembly protein V [Sansalvadorimonas verongulae]
MMDELQYQISELYRLMNNLIRPGHVKELTTDPDGLELDRVICTTPDGLETRPLPYFVRRSGADREDWKPSPGEPVVIFSPGGIVETGYVLCGVPSDAFPAASPSADVHRVVYSDGAEIEYDKASHVLKAVLPQGARMALVSDGGITFTGDLLVNGNITATQDVTDSVRSMQADRDIYNTHANNNHNPPAPNQ